MRNPLIIKQDAAKKARERMLAALLDFTPAQDLCVRDIKFIAEYTRTLCFDAIKEADSGEDA